MSRGQIHHILTNPVYAGRIRHKDKVFEGQHPAIIDPERWDRLQTMMRARAAKPRSTKQHRDPSPLAGKIFDGEGERLTPSHTKNGDRRYRYYISKRLVTGVSGTENKQRTWRIPAGQIESVVADAVRDRVGQLQKKRVQQIVSEVVHEEIELQQIWDVIRRVTIEPGTITIQLDKRIIIDLIGTGTAGDKDALTVTRPFSERRRGVEMKLAVQGSASLDETLLRNTALAIEWYAQVKQGRTFDEIAAAAQTSKRRVQHLIPLPSSHLTS